MPESEETELGKQTEEQEVEEEKGFGKKVSKAKYEKALEELEKAKADRDHWKNEYYRAYADTQNLRKSLEEDKRVAVRYRAEGFLSSLFPALDAFHVALNSPVQSEEVKNYLVGFQYIYNQIQKVLQDEGVSELAPKVGDPYDLNYMHAVEAIESEEVAPGAVVKIYSNGYKLHDRLIRPAMVVVAKAKEEPKQEEPAQEEKPAEA